MTPSSFLPRSLFAVFFLSGFCGLLYQIVWVRLAYASFGITTPVLSVVLSVFMAGLALGSYAGGRFVSRRHSNPARVFLRLYALSEAAIGAGSLAVPFLFAQGEKLLLASGSANSGPYLFFSAAVLFFSLLPWCIFMGATFPFMLAFLQKTAPSDGGFSFLYTANVLGAMAGALLTLLLVEALGFHGTLGVAGGLNAAVALAALALAGQRAYPPFPYVPSPTGPAPENPEPLSLPILFSTGFISMAMEVAWTRDFTIVLGNQVYSFASILFTYLLATSAGSWFYRWGRGTNRVFSLPILLAGAFSAALGVILLNDPRIQSSFAGVLLSLVPFCATLGYLTPSLVDRYSGGAPARASQAYAVNVLGCILGPLAASYILLPLAGVRLSLVLLSLPLFFFLIPSLAAPRRRNPRALALGALGILLLSFSLLWASDFEEVFRFRYPSYVLRRDYAATVVSCGSGMDKQIFVNGIGMTALVQETKNMAHLPLAFLGRKPQSALDICFGMGTTFRSLSRWNIAVTAVDLVPSVPRAFGYYFADAPRVLSNPLCSVVVDDGMRFLRRTHGKYDVITVDPPPPLEAAGSSLLYSSEFYAQAKSHLEKEGILQVWVPAGEYSIIQAVARSLTGAFPYVRAFASTDGFGYHFLASCSPLPRLTAPQLLKRMPLPAVRDLVEWFPHIPPQRMLQGLLSREIILSTLMNPDPRLVITNNRPYNEYYLLRRLRTEPYWFVYMLFHSKG